MAEMRRDAGEKGTGRANTCPESHAVVDPGKAQ